MRYCPELSVTAERAFSINAGLDASTTTPGSTAPEVSRTAPVIDPWADAIAGQRQAARTISATRHPIRMRRSFLAHEGRDSEMRETKLSGISVVGAIIAGVRGLSSSPDWVCVRDHGALRE